MNKLLQGKKIGLLMMSFLMLFVLVACSGQETGNTSEEYVIDQSDFINADDIIENIAQSQLTEAEINGLILMREEEKLARDVYKKLGDKRGTKIFTNIAQSEKTHTEAVKKLLDRYDIQDPVTTNKVGHFTSTELSELYTSLVKQGEKSLKDALIVGATIEDLDIYDLNTLLQETDNEDIIAVYNNLNRGSRNHLRAFMKQLERKGGSYTAQYISQSEFDAIINGKQEKGGLQKR